MKDTSPIIFFAKIVFDGEVKIVHNKIKGREGRCFLENHTHFGLASWKEFRGANKNPRAREIFKGFY